MRTMSAVTAPVVFEHDGTSCPGFPTHSFIYYDPPKWNFVATYLFSIFGAACSDSVKTAHTH